AYYIESLHKEGGGGDVNQVAWKLASQASDDGLVPIPGGFLTALSGVPAAPEGSFTEETPKDKAKGVAPNTIVRISHRDGKTVWTAANTSLKFDGVAVAPVYVADGNVLTITYTPPALLPTLSAHTFTLSYLDAGGNAATKDWTFTVMPWSGPAKDKVAGYPGLILGNGGYSADKEGHSGKAGDYAYAAPKGGSVMILDVTFMNAAVAADELSMSFWQKRVDTADSSSFWLHAPAANNGQRNFQAHLPWSNGHIYFDTSGCCNADQRIEADALFDLATWKEWHHFVFSKKGGSKQIWIDGVMFLEGSDAAPLFKDITKLYIGAGESGGSNSKGSIDDFGIYSKQLAEADVKALAGGKLPSDLGAAKGLIGYWDFNDAVPPAGGGVVNLKAVADGLGKVTITFTGAGVVQSSDSVNGTYADTAIKSGDVITAVGAKFYKGKK
ncbi:MAG: hypothetical protein EXS36_07320, partial [Pedosphaera sp.]|nr:hypothetical protein [Pedosphaera sp.]